MRTSGCAQIALANSYRAGLRLVKTPSQSFRPGGTTSLRCLLQRVVASVARWPGNEGHASTNAASQGRKSGTRGVEPRLYLIRHTTERNSRKVLGKVYGKRAKPDAKSARRNCRPAQ